VTGPLQAGSQPLCNWSRFYSLTNLHARSRYRQTDTQTPLPTTLPSDPKIAATHEHAISRILRVGSHQAARKVIVSGCSSCWALHWQPHCDLLHQQAQFHSNTQNYHAAPLSLLSAHDGGPHPHVQTGDPTFLIPIPSLRQVMHHTTIDHPSPLTLTPFPPQVLQIPTLIESLAPSGDAESQSGVWGSPA
jgi:hypothetical protein